MRTIDVEVYASHGLEYRLDLPSSPIGVIVLFRFVVKDEYLQFKQPRLVRLRM